MVREACLDDRVASSRAPRDGDPDDALAGTNVVPALNSTVLASSAEPLVVAWAQMARIVGHGSASELAQCSRRGLGSIRGVESGVVPDECVGEDGSHDSDDRETDESVSPHGGRLVWVLVASLACWCIWTLQLLDFIALSSPIGHVPS